MVCATDGRTYRTGRDCDAWGSTCTLGFCDDSCAAPERDARNTGCEYWAAHLPSSEGREDGFALLLSNDSAARARVQVSARGAQLSEFVLAPAEARVFEAPSGGSLPDVDGVSYVAEGAAYHIVSDQPIVALQFSPLEYDPNTGASSDASLLLPSHALGTDYTGVAYAPLSTLVATRGGASAPGWTRQQHSGYLALIGTQVEPTRVVVHPTSPVLWRQNDGQARRIEGGAELEVILGLGDVGIVANEHPPECVPDRPGYVVNDEVCQPAEPAPPLCRTTEACREDAFDLTGTRIASDRPIAVFGGHECAFVPYNRWACDHLEEQLPSNDRIGSAYSTRAIGVGGTQGANQLRLVAVEAETHVRLEPPIDGLDERTLGMGESFEVSFEGPLYIEADHRLLAVQYMVGQSLDIHESRRGDPSMFTLVPAAHFRTHYAVHLPEGYRAARNGQNYLLITRTPGVPIRVDGVEIEVEFETAGAHEVGTWALDGGPHQVDSDRPFGVVMFGLGSFTSYATPAGLGLEPILI